MNDTLPNSMIFLLWYVLKKYKKYLFLYIIIAFIAGFWNPFNFYLVSYVISLLSCPVIIGYGKLAFFSFLIVINFIIFDNLTWRSLAYVKTYFLPAVLKAADDKLLEYTLHHSYSFFQERMVGTIIKQIFVVLDSLEQIVANMIPHFFRMISLLLIALFFSFRVHCLFFFVLLIWILLFSCISVSLFLHLDILSQIVANKESIIGGNISDCITNAFNVKVFFCVSYEIQRRKDMHEEYRIAYKNKENYAIFVNSVQGGLIALMIFFSIFFLIFLYQNKLIVISDFTFILTLYIDVGHMMWWTMSLVQDYRKILAKAQAALDALLIPFEITDAEEEKNINLLLGNISFENVSFRYKKSDTKIFDNISVSISAGEKIGLVGLSGGGKSTFVNLILRLYDIQSGSIKIDMHDVRDISQNSLRRNVALIPQDTSLFNRSLLENIRYGNIFASDEEVFEAAKKAYADEFINSLPEKYNTLVGDRGLKLSGGQRQRIAIARAFLKNASILLLDEATSALDSYSEKIIQESLDILIKGKTTIVIAHRLSTLLKMDRILVFDKGQIIESGSHEYLLSRNGIYKKLWGMQSGNFLENDEIL